jgi:hypothetical protein
MILLISIYILIGMFCAEFFMPPYEQQEGPLTSRRYGSIYITFLVLWPPIMLVGIYRGMQD